MDQNEHIFSVKTKHHIWHFHVCQAGHNVEPKICFLPSSYAHNEGERERGREGERVRDMRGCGVHTSILTLRNESK